MKAVLTAAVMACLAAPLWAEDLFVREQLSAQPLSDAQDMVVIVSKLTLKPGGRIPLHTHPGDEHAVVVQGGTALMPNGKEVEFSSDMALFFSAGDVHGGVTNHGDADMVILTTHVVNALEPFETLAE
ncbi:cupin domain-containing protein [Tropicibacter naphthalenivorans]|uniref:Cupin type-2 domain-containing protein n=1 Tax=Tropicibacter naphthalenivorans TaxID=441103 RepID=A0A0N7LYP6_9RHOB|nr:cupin domain-containing protein [Tropicibacter naphthalenivorans]CUH75449.1 hypothetical protein TRN7648_00445 [Tropicibacter naphthalenivorans]SMC44424.1 Cupin domain-containing protein [Tropicibacter naphthalenivorans]